MNKLKFTPALIFCALSAIFNTVMVSAQTGGPAIGKWRSFFAYNQVNAVAQNGSTFYCATNSGFFTYNREDGMMSAYSKSNGMSDIGMVGVAYDNTSDCAILTYSNSNIDLFKDQTFYNLPELRLDQSSSNKTIYNVAAYQGRAYLSTNIGLVILNLSKKEVKETIRFTNDSLDVPVYATVISGNYIYAATGTGVFRIDVNSPSIQFQEQWEAISPAQVYHYLANVNGNLYAAEADSLFTISGTTAFFFQKVKYPVRHLDAGLDGLWVSAGTTDNGEKGIGILIKADGTNADSFVTVSPSQIIQLGNGEVWFGDNSRYPYTKNHGLRKRIGLNEFEPYFPAGPVTNTAFDVSAYNGEMWVAHGGKDELWNGTRNRAMFSHFVNDNWQNYPWVDNNEWVQDFVRILKDQNTGKVYAASFSGGLLEMAPDGNWKVFNQGYLANYFGNPELYQLSGLAVDADGNLWMTNYGPTGNELVVKTRDGQWPALRSIANNSKHSAADVIIDDYNQKWFIAPNNEGAVVYNDNGTLENSSDDQYVVLRKGKGAGGLPDNTALSIAKDKDGAIWIGTTNGVGIVNCPDQVIERACEASLKVVQADQFADHLFSNQSVKAIAVDGANRKWIGTSNGIWLISDDAEKTIYRFTQDNSPLPSNSIERINIDPITGDVYISTSMGLVSYRSTATEGKEENDEKLLVYPNPVPSGYGGMIAVRGLADNSDVRITDISGQLVYRVKALGGQAVWSGKDYTGKKVQSGVYLVFAINKDGTQKATGKFIIHE